MEEPARATGGRLPEEHQARRQAEAAAAVDLVPPAELVAIREPVGWEVPPVQRDQAALLEQPGA